MSTLKIPIMKFHGPSLVIGAGIAAFFIVISFLAINTFSSESELILSEITSPPPKQPTISFSTFTQNGSPILGNDNAPILIVEFGDYQCFFCNKFFHETEPAILENYVSKGLVKIVFKDFTIIGPDSINAAHASHCAEDQELFWEYHDILYNNWTGENNGWASSANLRVFAQQVGLNVDEFDNCMIDNIHNNRILASNADARALGIGGTPHFFVIGPDNEITRLPGAQPYEVFEKLFESMLNE